MTETATPGMGHNKPPFDATYIDGAKGKVREFADAAGDWLDLKTITTDEQAEKLNDFIKGTRDLAKLIEAQRVKDKEPWLTGSREVDAAYAPLMAPLKASITKARDLLTGFMNRKKAAEEAERQAEVERLRKERETAEKELAASQARNDVMTEAEREADLKKLDKAEKKAARPTRVKVASATGGGRSVGLRTIRTAKLIKRRTAFLYLEERHGEEIDALLVSLANRELRGGAKSVDGFEIVETTKAT